MPTDSNTHDEKYSSKASSLEDDYLTDAEAIVQNSPISPRQIITAAKQTTTNIMPQPQPSTNRTSAASQQSSLHGSAANNDSQNVTSSSLSSHHAAAASSSSAAVPLLSPNSPLPLSAASPLTANNSCSDPTETSSMQQRQQQQLLREGANNNEYSNDSQSNSRQEGLQDLNNGGLLSETNFSAKKSNPADRNDEAGETMQQQDEESLKLHHHEECSDQSSLNQIHHHDDNNCDDNNQDDGDDVDSNKAISSSQQDDANNNKNNNSSNKCTCTTSILLKTILCIFPKIQPLPPQTFLTLFLFNIIPPTCYILLFTQMGYGEDIYFVVSERYGEYAYSLALGLFGFIVLLYMFDAECWNRKVLYMCSMVIVLGVVLLTLCIADQFPYGMVCLFAIFQPVWLLIVKRVCYNKVDTRVYVSWLSGPLFLSSLCIGVAWMGWVFANPENQWNLLVRMELAEQSGCEPNYEEYPDCRRGGMNSTQEETCFSIESGFLEFPEGCDQSCTGVYNDCTSGFILWVGPVLVGMTMFFLSFFCTFLRTEGTKEKDIFNFGKLWLFILFAIWVTTSLAGIASGVTSALAALTLASFVASAVFIAVSFDRDERRDNTAAVFKRLRDKYGENNLDIARGLFIVTCAPLILIYFCFSITNQLIRKTRIFPCSHPVGDSNDMFTARTRRQIDQMKTWDRARVYTFAVYWGIFFMIMQVLVAKLTVVFLSWLIEQTASFGLGAVTALLVAVGVTMFLLPPVPGVPVYLTLGIVLPAQGHETLGWVGSIAYSIAIGLLLKLFSSALQQKMIGENLSRYVRVRQFVGVNSTLMKAMRLVLSQDGLSVPKVAILIGGPDWPTSVLCGILRLSLPQIILGTTPVVMLILPTCVTGALLYMASLKDESGNPEFSWAGTVSTITASLTALVQFGSMIVAAYYLEQAADKRVDDVAAIEDDAEVKKADDEAAHLSECYREVTKWEKIPTFPKLVMRSSLACIVIGCYIVQLFSSRCFTEHTLTDSIDDNLRGNVGNLFLPLGWIATGLFGASSVLLYVFIRWGKAKAKVKAKESAPKPKAEVVNYGSSVAYGSSDRTDFDTDTHQK